MPAGNSVPWSPSHGLHKVRCRYLHTCTCAHGMLIGKKHTCAWAFLEASHAVWYAGYFQPDSGQFGCLSCDSLGDFYQELQGQPSCRACGNHTRRYLGVLSAASRSSCQCKEGVYSRCVPCIAVEWYSSSCVGYYKPSPTPNPAPSPNLETTPSEGDAEEVYG